MGPLLWAATATAISLRSGVGMEQLSGAGTGAVSDPTAGLLFGGLLQRPDDAAQWALTLATTALSPARECTSTKLTTCHAELPGTLYQAVMQYQLLKIALCVVFGFD